MVLLESSNYVWLFQSNFYLKIREQLIWKPIGCLSLI